MEILQLAQNCLALFLEGSKLVLRLSYISTRLVGFPAQQEGALWLLALFNKFLFLGRF